MHKWKRRRPELQSIAFSAVLLLAKLKSRKCSNASFAVRRHWLCLCFLGRKLAHRHLSDTHVGSTATVTHPNFTMLSFLWEKLHLKFLPYSWPSAKFYTRLKQPASEVTSSSLLFLKRRVTGVTNVRTAMRHQFGRALHHCSAVRSDTLVLASPEFESGRATGDRHELDIWHCLYTKEEANDRFLCGAEPSLIKIYNQTYIIKKFLILDAPNMETTCRQFCVSHAWLSLQEKQAVTTEAFYCFHMKKFGY
jgi:hypothetical protein